MCIDALTQMIRRLFAYRLALCGKAEFLQYFTIYMNVYRFGEARQAMALGPLQVSLVSVAHVLV